MSATVGQPLLFNHWMNWILTVAFGLPVIRFHVPSIVFYNIVSSFKTALYNQLNDLNRFIGLGQHNATDKMGYTPLHYATRNGHLDACKMLLGAGANVNAVTTSGHVTSLMRASTMGK